MAYKWTHVDVTNGRFPLPELLVNVAIPKIELRQNTPCRHTLDIRDRWRDGGSQHRYWLQTDGVETTGAALLRRTGEHRCAAKYLLPVVAAILRDHYRDVRELEGTTVSISRRGVHIADIASLLVRELPPYLTPQRVSILNYARSDERGIEVYDAAGRFSHRA